MTQLAHLIGTSETAELLGWSVSKVKRAAKAGRLPIVTKLDGRTGSYLFNAAVITAIANRQESAA